jgi:hypothetical protein
MSKHFISSNKGSGISAILLSLAGLTIVGLICFNISDYSLYSYKKASISKAIDYAVCAAIQETDINNSLAGLANGFDGTTGNVSIDNIFINEVVADNAFYNTLQNNCGIKRAIISPYVMTVIVNPTTTVLDYIIKSPTIKNTGSVVNPSDLEAVINTNINMFYGNSGPDRNLIYVNGNPKTNDFKKRPYYMVFIKNYEIDGLFKKRTATFICFKSANMERKKINV